MNRYKLSPVEDMVIDQETNGQFSSLDLRNRDAILYKAWLLEGNTPDPADPDPLTAVPEEPEEVKALLDLADVLVSKGLLTEDEIPERIKVRRKNHGPISEQ